MGGRRGSQLIPEALAKIQRQSDETDQEWARRYERERRRAYRALKPKEPRKLRGPDKQLRKNAAPLHVREALVALPGETEEQRKRRYRKLVMREWRVNNKVRDTEIRRANQRTEKAKETRKRWLEANPEKAVAYQAEYIARNREKKLANLNSWRAKNPERIKQVRHEWFAKHPGYNATNLSKYREAAIQATPPWMWKLYGKDVERIYRQCARVSEKTGVPHHVDHIYPLRGKNSCGLHVPWNLQILPAALNGRKRNRSPEEFMETDNNISM